MMTDSFERYSKNVSAFSKEEVLRIHGKRVCVVGCGGLGGHAIETLARFGVGHLTLVDGDVFRVSNLNRQRFATQRTLGMNKAQAAQQALRDINGDVDVAAHPVMLGGTNADDMLAGHDLVLDCLDNRRARFTLDAACRRLDIPYVHGAIAGFYGQVATILPGDDTLRHIYADDEAVTPANELGNPPFIPQAVAAIQCSEALKLLAGRGDLLRHKMLYIDLLYNTFTIIPLAGEARALQQTL